MRTHRLLFGVAAMVVVGGCSHQDEIPRVSPAGPPVAVNQTEIAVPLPAHTPFDGDAKTRAVYLEFYAMGYRLAVTDADYTSLGCLCEVEGDAGRYEATVSGFFAGKEAGAAALAARRQAATSAGRGLGK